MNIFARFIYYWAEHILFFSVDIDNTPAGRWSAGSFPEHRLVIDPILAHGLLEYRHTDDVTGSLCLHGAKFGNVREIISDYAKKASEKA